MKGIRRVGFIGLGHMGTPMSARLVEAGYEVVGYDLAPEARRALEEAGGSTASSAAEAAWGADALILMLPSSDAVESVLEADGLLDAAGPGVVVIDMGSSDPLRTRRLSETLGARGARLVDAPVSGGVRGALAGALAIMVGCDEPLFARVEGLLGVLGTPRRVGDVGAGHALKAINNLMSASHLWVTSEAMLTGIRFGLDPAVMLATINQSSGRSGSTEAKWPQYVLTRRFDSGFALRLMVKDMTIATGLAEQLGVPHALSSRAVEAWQAAAEELPADADHTEVARWLMSRIEGSDD